MQGRKHKQEENGNNQDRAQELNFSVYCRQVSRGSSDTTTQYE